MSLSRVVLYSASVLLALLLGAVIFAYYNLPLLVEQQVKSQLQSYGVQGLSYQHIDVSQDSFSADKLLLRGVVRGVAYEATVSALNVAYQWRSLLAGRVKAVSMARLELAITGSPTQPSSTAESASALKLSSWLPGQSPATLAFESLDIPRWHVTYLPVGRPGIAASGSLQFKQQLQFELQSLYSGSQLAARVWTEGSSSLPRAQIRLGQGDGTVATLSARAGDAAAGRWQWQLQGELEFAPLLAWLRRFQAQGTAVELLDGLELAGGSSLDADISHPDELLLSPQNGQELLRLLTVNVTSNNRIERLDYADLVSKLRGDLPLALNFSQGKLTSTIGSAELQARLHTDVLSLPAQTRTWLGWGDTIPVRWHSPEDIAIAPNPHQSWPLRLRDNSLLIGDEGSQLRLDALQLDANIDAVTGLPASANLRAGLAVRLQQKDLPPLQLVLAHSGVPARGEFSAVLNDVPQSINLVLRAEGDLRKGRGRLHAVVESQDLSLSSAKLAPLLHHFGVLSKGQSPVITAGKLRLDSELQSQAYSLDELAQRSHLVVDNLSGEYLDTRFDDLGLSAEWLGVEQWRSTRPVRISMARLNTGLELRNITARLSLPEATPITAPSIRIDSFSAQLLGGWIVLPEPRPWDFAAASNSLALRAERWQLAELLALQQTQDIVADGVLEGELPLTLSGGRLLINDGSMHALAPGGRIQYRATAAAAAMAADSAQLQGALDLLGDFHYQKLACEVQLDVAGKLLLGLSLAGKNPAKYQGKTVNFNINLEQNIDPLLQSLRLSGNLVDKLEQRAQ